MMNSYATKTWLVFGWLFQRCHQQVNTNVVGAFLLLLTAGLTILQLHPLFSHPINSKYASSFNQLNACSVMAEERTEELSYLPKAYRTFSMVNRSEHTCSALKHFSVETDAAPAVLGLCQHFLNGSAVPEKEKLLIEVAKHRALEDETSLLNKTKNCTWLNIQLNDRRYVTPNERDFPIAFAINLDKYPQQFFRLLRVIYRPHNVYCIHYDLKAHSTTKQIVYNIATCAGNVILSRKLEDVHWGWYTLEDAYADCFSELVLARENYLWKYVVTLCGKELPLRTNKEMVSLLEPLNGMSSIQILKPTGIDTFKYSWKWRLNRYFGWISMKDEPLPPIPYGMRVYKSSAYVALSYDFVRYLLCSDVGITLRTYLKDVKIPEENVYAMLFMKPGVPGGYREELREVIFPVISVIWLDGNIGRRMYLYMFHSKYCAGVDIHSICMVGIGDLNKLSYRPGLTHKVVNDAVRPTNRGPLFHNRYSIKHDQLVMDCMEEELAERNYLEFKSACLSH